MLNRGMSILALLVLAGFVGILLLKVPRLDLGVVIVLTVAMAAYDFFFYKGSSGGH